MCVRVGCVCPVRAQGFNCHRSPRGLQIGRCPSAASSAVSGLRSHNPPAPPQTSTSAGCSLTLGPWRFPEPTAACRCPGDLVGGKHRTGTQVGGPCCVERRVSQVWPRQYYVACSTFFLISVIPSLCILELRDPLTSVPQCLHGR